MKYNCAILFLFQMYGPLAYAAKYIFSRIRQKLLKLLQGATGREPAETNKNKQQVYSFIAHVFVGDAEGLPASRLDTFLHCACICRRR